jgi:hypothetical protein
MPKVKLEGKGYWEDEYNRRANLIPGVNQRLLAEIGTDLKHRLKKLFSSKLTAPFLNPFGIDTRKEALVKEALATLTRLSGESKIKSQEIVVGNEMWFYNPLTQETSWDDPQKSMEQLIQESKTTGPLGKPVVRENLPKYAPITSLDPRGIYSDSRKLRELIRDPYPKEFKRIDLNTFVQGTPIPWGKFNTVFIEASDDLINNPLGGHVGVLIRNLTEPISYSWYDSHGTSWRNPRTFFYQWRNILDSIVGDSQVNFNDVQHQCTTQLCQSFAKIRATYSNLTNQEYDQELRRTAQQIANDPNFEVVNNVNTPTILRVGPDSTRPSRFYPIENLKEALQTYSGTNPPVIGIRQTGYAPGDVYAAPLAAQKIGEDFITNPQQPVPFSTAVGRGKICKKCGLPKYKN